MLIDVILIMDVDRKFQSKMFRKKNLQKKILKVDE